MAEDSTRSTREGVRIAGEERPGRNIVERAMERGDGSLGEAQAKVLFAAYGIPVTPGALVHDSGEAVRVARDLGFPVVMKGASPGLLHKSDVGLVLTDVNGEQAVRDGYALLRRRGGEELEAVLVERMVSGGREFVVGMTRDAQFGPVVMFGLGGVLTETLEDVVFGVAPLDDREAGQLLHSIRARRLLGEFRGQPAVDRDALMSIIQAVGLMALDHPEIQEVDANPILIDGSSPVAVDALVTLGPPVERPERPAIDLSSLDAVFAARSVALVGASNDVTKWGGMILANLMSGGYEGAIYPVNPGRSTVFGLPAYDTVGDIPETPDVVLIAVPAALVEQVVREAGEMGVRAAVVISAGFSEIGDEGARREQDVALVAAQYGMALIGPNCMGVMSSWNRFYATGATIMHPTPGPGSFISQSGNMGIQLMGSAEERRGGIGKFVGIGNEALFDSTDLFEYFRTDDETGLILAYIEGFDDGRRFLEEARKATLLKPVIVLRAAVSEYGQQAAASHTGTMAGSGAVYEAVVRQSGIISTTDPDEFLDLTFCLSYLPLPRGSRVAVVTMGGGWGVLAADEVARTGLELADIPPDVIEEISRVLPPFWSHGNPVDLVGTIEEGAAEHVVEAVAASDAVDAVIVLGVVGLVNAPARVREEHERMVQEGGRGFQEVSLPEEGVGAARERRFIDRVARLMEDYDKPIVNVSFVPVEQAVFESEEGCCAVILPSPLRSVRAISKMAAYHDFLEARGGLDSLRLDRARRLGHGE